MRHLVVSWLCEAYHQREACLDGFALQQSLEIKVEQSGGYGIRPGAAQIMAAIVSAAICLAFDASNETVVATSDKLQDEVTSTRLENVIAANDVYNRNRKKWGNFDHKKHTTEYKVPCWQCHGDRKGGNIGTPLGGQKKCNQCHTGTPSFR
jgi:hypothetical protein